MELECLYQDFYDVDQRYREEKTAHSIECNALKVDFSIARVENILSEMKDEIREMNARITNMGWTITLAISIVGIVLALLSVYK